MKQQSLEKFEYSVKDIESLIYEDIRKRCPKTLRQRVQFSFDIVTDPSDNDYCGMCARQILQRVNVTVDTTK